MERRRTTRTTAADSFIEEETFVDALAREGAASCPALSGLADTACIVVKWGKWQGGKGRGYRKGAGAGIWFFERFRILWATSKAPIDFLLHFTFFLSFSQKAGSNFSTAMASSASAVRLAVAAAARAVASTTSSRLLSGSCASTSCASLFPFSTTPSSTILRPISIHSAPFLSTSCSLLSRPFSVSIETALCLSSALD